MRSPSNGYDLARLVGLMRTMQKGGRDRGFLIQRRTTHRAGRSCALDIERRSWAVGSDPTATTSTRWEV